MTWRAKGPGGVKALPMGVLELVCPGLTLPSPGPGRMQGLVGLHAVPRGSIVQRPACSTSFALRVAEPWPPPPLRFLAGVAG